jgi:glycine/D-amino acid oxidase-like deaminating enzyme
MQHYDVAIIGGGFFGCSIALHLRQYVRNVVIIEKEADIMTRASYNNQARVHGGYHYSRSLLTALRSRVSFTDFVAEYEDCVDASFDKYYAVGRQFSKVSSRHFYQFCKRIGASIEPAPPAIRKLFNDNLIEDVFTVKEYAFDSLKLRARIKAQLAANGVELQLNTEATSIAPDLNHGITLRTTHLQTGAMAEYAVDRVFNCGYAHINSLNHRSHLPLVPLKHELTEMALVDVPDELRDVGITVMDGPFFSIMPFPPRGLHTLSHVRYTPHVEWHDSPGDLAWRNGHDFLANNRPRSVFGRMVADAQRYVPAVGKSRHVDSLWEVKTILPSAEHNDSRPILFVQSHGNVAGYTCIMGGKIDNVQDVLREIDILYGG